MLTKPFIAAATLAFAGLTQASPEPVVTPHFSGHHPAMNMKLDLTVTPRGYVVGTINGQLEVSSCEENVTEIHNTYPVLVGETTQMLEPFADIMHGDADVRQFLDGINFVIDAGRFMLDACQKSSRPTSAEVHRDASAALTASAERINISRKKFGFTPR